jgi:hypothetical protein
MVHLAAAGDGKSFTVVTDFVPHGAPTRALRMAAPNAVALKPTEDALDEEGIVRRIAVVRFAEPALPEKLAHDAVSPTHTWPSALYEPLWNVA